MRLRSRNAIALVIAALILIGAGVALAQSQSPSPTPSSEHPAPSSRQGRHGVLEKNAFLDDVARRLGVPRSRVDAALKGMALAEVKWAEDNGFITKDEADRIRERINRRDAKGPGRFGLHGPLGLKGLGGHVDFVKGRLGRGPGLLRAAANYLGLTQGDLRNVLRSKTLAQVARDQGKSVAGLQAALRTARKTELDEAVSNGKITGAQEVALLDRFDSQIGDLINGIPPQLTELARRLGVARPRLIAAIRDAAVARVDAALAQGKITKAQADAIKQRIRTSATWPLGGGIGFCGGPGRSGFRFGGADQGVRFDPSDHGEDVLGL